MQNGQGKCIRYVMSHETGKIEILGRASDREWLFKYHQAKEKADEARLFTEELADGQCWL